MSRTAHHIRSGAAAPWKGGPLTITLHDLRFSARLRAEAERAGRRVRPRPVRRRVVVRHLPRLLRDSSVARAAAQEERRARARLRTAARTAVRTARTPGPHADPTADPDIAPGTDPHPGPDTGPDTEPDILPARHRRAALWLA
ncbi:hypothetical protein ABT084_17210 [Streptomyces sp. NPDC002138]|uniref:hypothetical protein n=1 Tax=Streptomyces sp. NPDC002138 TaxID=3154410 RepID=UPI00331BEBC7